MLSRWNTSSKLIHPHSVTVLSVDSMNVMKNLSRECVRARKRQLRSTFQFCMSITIVDMRSFVKG